MAEAELFTSTFLLKAREVQCHATAWQCRRPAGWLGCREAGVPLPPVVSPLMPLLPLHQRPGSSESQVRKGWLCCCSLFECQTHSPRLPHPIPSCVCSGQLWYLWLVATATVKSHAEMFFPSMGVCSMWIYVQTAAYTWKVLEICLGTQCTPLWLVSFTAHP